MTKREHFARLAELARNANDTESLDFIAHELELLDKKNKAPKKATATQIANEALKDRILDFLSTQPEPMTATAIANALDISVNKASALLTQLREDNSVVREVVKRKAYFTIA